MPVLASTFYIAKNYRRFRYAIQSTVPAATSTWTDATYRYVKWAAGTGSLVVHELPMDGVAEIGYQVVGAGGEGSGGAHAYYYGRLRSPGSGGGGGAVKEGTANLNSFGSMAVSVGAASDERFASISMSGYPRFSVAQWGRISGTLFTAESSSLGSLGTFSGVTANAGSDGSPGNVDIRDSPLYLNYTTRYGGASGDGVAGQEISANDVSVGPNGANSSSAKTLWDGSKAGYGGLGGTLTVAGATSTGYGSGAGGAGLNGAGTGPPEVEVGGEYSGLPTGGVVIIRWPLVYESAS